MAVHPQPPTLSQPALFLMAVAIAASVATLYYNQPLLPEIAVTFGVSEKALGLVSSATQLGYALAILLLSPLGDITDRRRILNSLSALLTLSLLVTMISPSFGILLAASFAIGLGANIVQQLIPLGANLAAPAQRGKVVGTLMTGLTVGILLSRTISGLIAEHFGWRSVYLAAPISTAVIGLLMNAYLPRTAPRATLSYPALLRSMGKLFITQRLLRECILTGMLWYVAFHAFWASIAIHVRAEPFNYSVQQAGFFGMAAISGVLSANASGRLVQKHDTDRVITLALVIVILSFGVMVMWGHTLTGLVLGSLLMNLGLFGAQIPNQVRVFSIDQSSQNRMNAVYMLFYFGAASVGAALGVWILAKAGWTGVALFGLCLTLLALANHVYNASTRRS